MSNASIYDLGCEVDRVVVVPWRKVVDIFVPHNAITDMGKAIAYAQCILKDVEMVSVFEAPRDELVVKYVMDTDKQWSARISAV